jgi:Ca2+-transporting ATPase
MNPFFSTTPQRYLIPSVFLIGLLLLSYQVLSGFFMTIIWAFIIVYVTWTPYCWLKRRLNDNANLSAALMTLFIASLIFLTLFWLAAMLQEEVKVTYQTLVGYFNQGNYQLPDAIKRLPWLASYLQRWVDLLNHDRSGLIAPLALWAKQWLGEFAQFLGGIGRYVMKMGFVLVTVFFCFREGHDVIQQLQRGIIRFLGDYQQVYLQAAADTTRAVVYGLVLAAMAQGLMAGLGYAVAGVNAPVLFGVMTALLALVPMAAMLVWIPIGLSLIASGQVLAGSGLLLWGFLVVSTIDNVIRPIVISGTSQVPFLVVMFGVFGGLSAFGAVGLFLGPVILSVLLSVWRAWLLINAAEKM